MRRASRLSVLLMIAFITLNSAAQAINPVNVTNLLLGYSPSSIQVSGNYLYSVGGGLQIFDISDRANPVSLATAPVSFGGSALSISGNYAFVLDGAFLHVFDISNPSYPTSIAQVAGTWLSVTVAGHYAYLDTAIYDISNPRQPQQVGQMQINGGPVSWAGKFVCVSGNYAYLAVNGIGLVVFDVSDPTSPRQVGQAETGFRGDYLNYAVDIAVSGDFAYVCALTNGAVQVFNISDHTNPTSVFSDDWYAYRLALSGNYAYVIGGNSGNLSVLDISNPTNTSIVGSASTQGTALAIAASGNYFYVAQAGLPMIAIYSLGAPVTPLNVVGTGYDNLTFLWPTPTGAFAVQQAPTLNSAKWTTLTNMPVVVGSQNQVTIPKPQGTMFYRLISQ